jgi:hypothetical protein
MRIGRRAALGGSRTLGMRWPIPSPVAGTARTAALTIALSRCNCLVQMLTELLEVVTTHARRRVTGDRAEDRASGGRAQQQPAADCWERELRHDQASGQAHTGSEHAARARGRLVVLDDVVLPSSRRSTIAAS